MCTSSGVEQAMRQGGRIAPPDFDAMGRDWTFAPPPLSDGVTVYGAAEIR